MTILSATRTLVPLALLLLLAACDRPKGPPPPKAAAATATGAAAPSTVALSGTILDPQPTPLTAKPAMPANGSAASAAAGRVAQDGADPQALRDFQAEQERRDRELLDQDLSEAQLRAREDGSERERANAALDESESAPPEQWNDGREAYVLPREDGDWSPSYQLAPDHELPIDEPPYDEPPYDEPPYDEPPYDEPPYDDGYDPRDGTYRP